MLGIPPSWNILGKKFAANLFNLKGVDYLVIVDYFSCYPEAPLISEESGQQRTY